MTFIHLRAQTSYSLLESAIPIGRLADLCVKDAMPAVGITDTDNLFGALEASEKLAGAGVQPIIGTTLMVSGFGRLALLARSEAGYGSLCSLSSEAHLRPAGGLGPSVAMEVLAEHAGGLLALSGGFSGAICHALRQGKADLARTRARQLHGIFGDRLYIEIQRHGLPDESAIEPELLQLAYDLGLPIVATHECLFAEPADHEAHDVLLAIAAGKRVFEDDRRRVGREQWFKPQAAMKALFRDLPEAISSTVEIAKRCSWRPKSRPPLLPHVSDDEQTDLRRQASEGLVRRLGAGPADGFTIEDYQARLDYECGVIAKMGFAGYFLIVADFIGWAKDQGIPVGPGRGSGAGSVVAWALRITDLDPLRFGLLFERFLNPERVSMPDFDIDFCQERREEVIRYVQQTYGEDRVAQIITHGTLQARAVLRSVGRALSMPFGQVDRICKLVPNNPADPVSLDEAIEIEPRLGEEIAKDETTARLVQTARRLEGLYSHASTHAAGLVIGDRPLAELVPLYRDPKSTFPVSQFNWKIVEKAGLVKFDFLGLKTLTVIRKTLEQIERNRGLAIDLPTLPFDDAATFELLAAADTVGVFQLESDGMRGSLRQLKPDRFEDIIAMVALYRPGPMDNIPAYVARKHGKQAIEYPHELIAPVLEETYGVIIYQEQVIQIAQTLSGYTLGQADLLRRAMGKKDKNEMAQQRARFVEGAQRNGLSANEAAGIFDLVDKFAGYGFNKSHAAAYALIAYQTAYLKANFCEEFLAASMTLEMGDVEKLAVFARECRRAGIKLDPPCIRSSDVGFLSDPDRGRILYALGGVKGVGAAAAEAIVNCRETAYVDITDFARRIDSRAINKKVIETLAGAGAFRDFGIGAATVHDGASTLLDYARKEQDDAKKGIMDLFGSIGGSRPLSLPEAAPWTIGEQLHAEYEAIGHFLSGHPLDEHRNTLTWAGAIMRRDLDIRAARTKHSGTIAAVCLGRTEKVARTSGKRYAIISLSDERGQFEAFVFEQELEASREIMIPGSILAISAQGEPDEMGIKYVAWQISTMQEFVESRGANLRRRRA